MPHRRREAGTFQAAQKRSKKSWNGNRTGTEIVRRVYRVTRRKTEARESAPGPVRFPIHTWLRDRQRANRATWEYTPHAMLQEAPGTNTRTCSRAETHKGLRHRCCLREHTAGSLSSKLLCCSLGHFRCSEWMDLSVWWPDTGRIVLLGQARIHPQNTFWRWN